MTAWRATCSAILVASLSAGAVEVRAAAQKPKPCPDGRYVAQGDGLIDQPGARVDTIAVTGRRVEIVGACAPRRARVKATRRGTQIIGQWPSCGVARKVRLTAWIAPDCHTATGKITAKGHGPRRFDAIASTGETSTTTSTLPVETTLPPPATTTSTTTSTTEPSTTTTATTAPPSTTSSSTSTTTSSTSTTEPSTTTTSTTSSTSTTQPHELSTISVTPTNPIIELDLNTPGAQDFTATGHYLDGSTEDLTGQAVWASSNAAVGALTGATLDIPGFSAATAEVSTITATFGGFVGEAQIAVVAYRRTGPQQDLFFILPYVDPAGNATKPLEFSTAVPSLDVFFLMDTTGSMLGEITNLQTSLTGTVVPGIQAAVSDSQFGVGAFEDFPDSGYGSPHGSDCGAGGLSTPDQPFHLFQTITPVIAAVSAGVAQLRTATGPIGCGLDWPEAMFEGLYQASTGDGLLMGPNLTSVPANHTGVGGVAFRSGTMPVIVDISDAMSHGPGETGSCPTTGDSAAYVGAVAAVAHSRAQTKAALGNICARVVGVASIEPGLDALCTSQADLEDLATATGARVPPEAWDSGTRPAGCAAGQCCTNVNGSGRAPDADGICPLVFRTAATGAGLGSNIVTGIQMLTRFATFDVTSQRVGVTTDVMSIPLPVPHTTADFLRLITPTGFMKPPPPPNLPDPTFDATTFHTVTPGTKVSFDVAAFNDFVLQTDKAQIFRATIRVLAGGCTPLDQREVLILVPPTPGVI